MFRTVKNMIRNQLSLGIGRENAFEFCRFSMKHGCTLCIFNLLYKIIPFFSVSFTKITMKFVFKEHWSMFILLLCIIEICMKNKVQIFLNHMTAISFRSKKSDSLRDSVLFGAPQYLSVALYWPLCQYYS